VRRLLLICAVVAAASVLAAEATAAPIRPMTGTLSGYGGWCCGRYATLTGTGTIPGVGHVSYVADWLSGCDPFSEPQACFTTAHVVLTAKNGDSLTLDGGADARDDGDGGFAFPWGVSGGTGRFTSATGSGTMSFVIDFSSASGTLTLSGTLGK